MVNARPKVIVAIPTNGNDGREQLSGVFDYINEHPDWEMQIIHSRTDIANGVLESALGSADGLILSIAYGTTLLADRLLSDNPRLRAVVTNDHLVPLVERNPNCRTLLIDSVSVGRDAAHYFGSLGRFASYGFVHGAIRYPWSIKREEGFRSALPRKASLFVFPGEEGGAAANDPTSLVISHDELGRWVEGLPKPAAVFGANDLFASEVITVCERLGLKVPQQVSVVGCDNDPLVWRNAHPPLSSFQLPFREVGYRAAQTLDRLLHGKNPPQRTVRVAGTRLFERESTANIPPATALVEKARAYIAEHACDGIRVADVVLHLGVSRSLLDLRFRQVCGKSVLEDILDVRFAEVRRQLSRTGHTILQIGHECGFNDPDNLKRMFKMRYGMSMRQFRTRPSQAAHAAPAGGGYEP
ncbi:MAG: substrate-binding domain-containing protein [Kiritimatiellae bacterium]|nr:substrate-binding domain-containing protein [Kiritimatiellia bacterium]MBQ3343059.1 substrate-binding domain-containing protein [Kiritimatiellia bacterium]